MKELNRREFLTLSGASVALLALAACGSTPSTPVVPTTGKEAKVLEAINKYRGALPPLTPDSGLKPAAEIAAEVAKGKRKYEDSIEDLGKIMSRYKDVSAPIGIAFDPDTGDMTLLCVYSEDVEKMAKNLPLQLAEDTQEDLKSASLIAIQVFESEGVKYWVAFVAKGKVNP